VFMCEKTNEQCELCGSMKHDELEDMGRFVTMRKKSLLRIQL
jgi:hypothetical protein